MAEQENIPFEARKKLYDTLISKGATPAEAAKLAGIEVPEEAKPQPTPATTKKKRAKVAPPPPKNQSREDLALKRLKLKAAQEKKKAEEAAKKQAQEDAAYDQMRAEADEDNFYYDNPFGPYPEAEPERKRKGPRRRGKLNKFARGVTSDVLHGTLQQHGQVGQHISNKIRAYQFNKIRTARGLEPIKAPGFFRGLASNSLSQYGIIGRNLSKALFDKEKKLDKSAKKATDELGKAEEKVTKSAKKLAEALEERAPATGLTGAPEEAGKALPSTKRATGSVLSRYLKAKSALKKTALLGGAAAIATVATTTYAMAPELPVPKEREGDYKNTAKEISFKADKIEFEADEVEFKTRSGSPKPTTPSQSNQPQGQPSPPSTTPPPSQSSLTLPPGSGADLSARGAPANTSPEPQTPPSGSLPQSQFPSGTPGSGQSQLTPGVVPPQGSFQDTPPPAPQMSPGGIRTPPSPGGFSGQGGVSTSPQPRSYPGYTPGRPPGAPVIGNTNPSPPGTGGRQFAQPSQGDQAALVNEANRLGVNPVDLATVINYETAGTMSPNIQGGKGGRYRGLIQFGPAEQERYGIQPGQSFSSQIRSAGQFLQDRGLKQWLDTHPNATQEERRNALYSTINAGSPGEENWNKSDRPGATVRSHVQEMFSGRHYQRAKDWLSASQPQSRPGGGPIPSSSDFSAQSHSQMVPPNLVGLGDKTLAPGDATSPEVTTAYRPDPLDMTPQSGAYQQDMQLNPGNWTNQSPAAQRAFGPASIPSDFGRKAGPNFRDWTTRINGENLLDQSNKQAQRDAVPDRKAPDVKEARSTIDIDGKKESDTRSQVDPPSTDMTDHFNEGFPGLGQDVGSPDFAIGD